MKSVRPERTNWRDDGLSQRHRKWGWHCPAVDIDLLFIEFDKGEARALVEYKNEHAAPQYPSHPTYRAMRDLADRAAIPLFACRYSDDFEWFRVTPLNNHATSHLGDTTTMTEAGWIIFMHRVRGRDMSMEEAKHLIEKAEK